MNQVFMRRVALVSGAFWAITLVIAAGAAAATGESFRDYLIFTALIVLGVTLILSIPIANQLTAFEAKVWSTGPYLGEDRSTQAGGFTALGLLLILTPQVALISLLPD